MPSPEAGAELQDRFADAFALRALAHAGQLATERVCATFGPAALRIETCGAVLSRVALDSLRHATIGRSASADFRLVMIDGKETGIHGPPLNDPALAHPAVREQPDGAGARPSTLTLNDEWNTACLIDAGKRHAIVWIADARAVPEWVVYDQVRNALHWLSFGRDFGLFHAAALQFGAVGCLIAGKSGSGKSTITAAAIAHGFDTAGDDFVLVETMAAPFVHAIFDTIKLDEKSLMRFPQYMAFIRNPVRRIEDKAIVHLFDIARARIASGFPLHAILHSRLTGERRSRIVSSPPSNAFRALAPSSLLLLRGQEKQVSANCSALVTRLATYAFEIGSDIDAAVAELAGFMRGLKQ